MAFDGIIQLASAAGQAIGAFIGGGFSKGITEFNKLLTKGMNEGKGCDKDRDGQDGCCHGSGWDGLNGACEFGKNGCFGRHGGPPGAGMLPPIGGGPTTNIIINS